MVEHLPLELLDARAVVYDLGERLLDDRIARGNGRGPGRQRLDRGGEVFDPDLLAARRHHDALDQVPELAHVARKAVAREGGHRFEREHLLRRASC